MKIALAGKPGCGRSTLFKALAGSADIDTDKPLTVDVPDRRLDFLADLHRPQKKTHAKVVFIDVPSPVLSPKNLGMLRTAAVLALVLDNYAMGEVTGDLQELESEMILSDMALCEKRLARLTKEGAGSSREASLLQKLMEHMESGHPLRLLALEEEQLEMLAPYSLLSLKPLMVIPNRMGDPVTPEEELGEMVHVHGGTMLPVDAGFELELTEIDEDERGPFLESVGFSGSGADRLVRRAYEMLSLMVFFTVGSDEVRAWTLRKGATALEAAGAIHSDMARGFIRAVVVPFEVYSETPDRNLLRESGMLGIEGRDYKVRDGDVIEIRFNV